MIPPDPTPDDLQPWARRAFEEAYRRRPREQASREDLAYGFLRALVWARVASAFRDERQASICERPPAKHEAVGNG